MLAAVVAGAVSNRERAMSAPQADINHRRHIKTLDGVRATSILLVLAGHLLPLGPKALQINEAAASGGMALFFILSGFLITRLLMDDNDLTNFMVKRLARIVPLAWLFMALVFVLFNRDLAALASEMSFTLNYHTGAINTFNPHLWSLCVEVQFYIAMGVIFRFFRRPAPYIVLGLCLLITALKLIAHDPYSMQTQLRGDELLAGSLLYMSVSGAFGDHGPIWRRLERFTPALAILLFLSARPGLGLLDYIRAYAAALLVGSVLFTRQAWLSHALSSRPMAYIAKISYALYIIHIGAAAGAAAVLGVSSKLTLYLVQRPITFVATFIFAHLSTLYYEAPWNAFGRALIRARANRSSRATLQAT